MPVKGPGGACHRCRNLFATLLFLPSSPTKYNVNRQVRERDDNGWRWAAADDPPIIGHVRHSGYEFRSETTGKRTVLAYPATPGCLPHHRSGSLIGNESSARGLDTQEIPCGFGQASPCSTRGRSFSEGLTPKQAWEYGISIRLVFLPNFRGLMNGRQRLFMAIIKRVGLSK